MSSASTAAASQSTRNATHEASKTNVPNHQQHDEPRPPLYKVWILAARPHTLTASISPVVVGHFVCYSHYATDQNNILPSLTLRWMLFCILIQLGTNLHNDYADYIKGADNDQRVGQARATQRKWLTPSQTCRGSDVCLILALSIGTSLAHYSNNQWDWFFMVGIVATSVFNAVAYTGGPYPLGYIGLSNVSIGYSGLGDVFVFLYFGLVATLAIPYLYLVKREANSSWSFLLVLLKPAILLALPVGWLGTAIIVVNNLRDRHTDVAAGKRTLAVRFGATFCRVEYALLVLGSYLVLPLLCRMDNNDDISYYRLLPVLSLPLAIPQLRAVSLGEKDGADLNNHVGGTARVQFLFCILLSVGLRLEKTYAS